MVEYVVYIAFVGTAYQIVCLIWYIMVEYVVYIAFVGTAYQIVCLIWYIKLNMLFILRLLVLPIKSYV